MPPSTAAILSLFGLLVGAYGAITGAGGGFLIVPALLFSGLAGPEQAAGTSLVAIVATSLSASVSYARQRRIDVRTGLMMAGVSVPGALVGAHLTRWIAGPVFHLAFGAILILVSLWLLLKPSSRAQSAVRGPAWGRVSRDFHDAQGNAYAYSFSLPMTLALAALLAVMSSALGIGGGVIMVPFMVHMLSIPAHVATATSQLVLVLSAPIGAISHAALGHVLVGPAVCLALGAVIGGQLGARVAHRLRGPMVLRLLALALIATGARMLWRGLEG